MVFWRPDVGEDRQTEVRLSDLPRAGDGGTLVFGFTREMRWVARFREKPPRDATGKGFPDPQIR
jgi:hypothetical protein